MTKRSEETDKELEAVLGSHKTRIRIVGTGGAGNNTVTRLLEVGIKGVDVIAINTDAQDLLFAKADHKVLIGKNITNGLGAGSDPRTGEDSARESAEDIKNVLSGSDMVFVTCGLGGGTGTGSTPIIAEIARSSGALTIAVVTLPFTDEGIVRWENALKGLDQLQKNVDTVILVQNDRLLDMVPDMPLNAAFKVADEILVNAVKGITELVTEKGLVNLDFADVRTIMQNGGMAMIGLGQSDSDSAENAKEAAEKALQNPLLDIDITGAKSALINITGGRDMSLKSAKTVMKIVAEQLDPSAKIIWGARLDESMNHTLRVMLIVTCLKLTKRPATEIELAIKQSRELSLETKTVIKSEITPEIKSQRSVDSAQTQSQAPSSKKTGGKVFSEIFVEETQADISVLKQAIGKLAVGDRSKNDIYLKRIKNACASIFSAAELFAFKKIAEFVKIIGLVTERAINGEFDLTESFLVIYRQIPFVVEGLIADEEKSNKMAVEIKQKFTRILELFQKPQKENTQKAVENDSEISEKKKLAISQESVKVQYPSEEIEVPEGVDEDKKAEASVSSSEVGSDNNKPSFSKVEEAVKFINKVF